ncbi:hypothetical protein RB195_001292 [Necator americanus]|uniref:Uncharacterized protein n=2 Tax=Necator americanus TaxID=51031 RepID=A0ABR1DDK7_NECAM
MVLSSSGLLMNPGYVRRHQTDRGERRYILYAAYDTGEELFLGTCDSRGVGGVGVFVNRNMAVSIDSFEKLTMRKCGSTPMWFAPTSSYGEEECEAFYMDLEQFYTEGLTFYKNHHRLRASFRLSASGKIPSKTTSTTMLTCKTSSRLYESGAARAAGNQEPASELARLCGEAIKEGLKERRAEVLAGVAEAEQSIHYAHRSIANRKTTTSPGLDKIKPKHLKYPPPVPINTLARLYTRYLLECKVYEQFKTNKTVLLNKKGDP